MNPYQKTIDRALEHVRSQQSPDGSFTSLSGFSPTDFFDAVPRRTTFFTSNILACLQNLPSGGMDVQKAAAKFLLLEKSERWSFNYWARGAVAKTESPHPPYPDDLDDTFAALAALARHDNTLIDARAFSAIAKMLTAREVSEGGPYRTWLVAEEANPAWQDVDLVVNSTVGYALSLIGVHIPNLEHFISDAVRRNRLTSPYYPSMFHIGYFLSRFYGNKASGHDADARSKLADTITDHFQESDAESITTLEHAMAISSLVDLGYADRTTPMADLLAKRVEYEGFLPYAFCIDPSRDGRRCYAGGSALTAAFSAEALARCAAIAAYTAPDLHEIPTIHEHIRSLARTSYRSIGKELREIALIRTEQAGDEKITTLAYDFRDALYKSGKIVPVHIAEQLSLANLYGWMAYEIYDDALDGDSGRALIPCGNFFLRSLTEIYEALATHLPEIRTLFANEMNCIDNANSWEQKHCLLEIDARIPRMLPQFGDHQTLADRSIGHAMGPLAELLLAGYDADSEAYKNCESFFRHYLIARQLHDDAHDWEDDLMRGRVNSVGALILNRFKEGCSNSDAMPTVVGAMPKLRTLFWEDVIDRVAHMIEFHITAARRARQRSSILDNADFMESALRTLESGARRAVKERDEALVFLKEYKGHEPSGAAL